MEKETARAMIVTFAMEIYDKWIGWERNRNKSSDEGKGTFVYLIFMKEFLREQEFCDKYFVKATEKLFYFF